MYPSFKKSSNQPAPKITDEKFVSGCWTGTRKFINKTQDVAVFWVAHQAPGTGQDHAELRFCAPNGDLLPHMGYVYTFRRDLEGAIKFARSLQKFAPETRRTQAAAILNRNV